MSLSAAVGGSTAPDPSHVAGCSLVIGNDASGPERITAHVENSWNCTEGEMSFGLCWEVA